MSVAAEPATLPERPAGAQAERAAANLRANLRALADKQPTVADCSNALPSNINWVLARDGSPTAMLDHARWWAGCSVPLAAARFMLKSMEVRGVVGCFLNPVHAAQLRVALDLLTSRQAVVAIVPDERTLAVLLHTADFSKDLSTGRLWLAAGRNWDSELRGIFLRNPGLTTPVEFIRPITADPEPTNALIDPAQRVFAEVSTSRRSQLQAIRDRWEPAARGIRHLCLLAPSEFRLWDDAALVLSELDMRAAGLEVRRVDSDRPTTSSPLALAMAASECDAVLAANVFRTHLPGVVPDRMPWIAWATSPKFPPAKEVGAGDRLLLSSSTWVGRARELGWDESRVAVAAWPATPLPEPVEGTISIVADTRPLNVPKQVEQYSSQVLLWEFIRDELTRDPFLATGQLEDYLTSRRASFQIGDDGFDASIFREGLIIPAVQQGLARRLIKDQMPVRLLGRGWDAIEGFTPFHRGPVTSREHLARVISQSDALVDVWPWYPGHAIEMSGRPVIRTRRMHDFLSDVRGAFNGTLKPPANQDPFLSPEVIGRVVRPCR